MKNSAGVWAELRVHHCETVVGDVHIVLVLHNMKVGWFDIGSEGGSVPICPISHVCTLNLKERVTLRTSKRMMVRDFKEDILVRVG